jgi:hypothetical protein
MGQEADGLKCQSVEIELNLGLVRRDALLDAYDFGVGVPGLGLGGR